MVCVFLSIKSEGVRENIVIAMVRTTIIEHTLGRNTLPE